MDFSPRWFFFLGGASRRLEPRVFCLMEREVNWREPFTPTLCLHSGRSCQEGTYDKIRSPQNHGPPRPAEADAAVTCAAENIKPPDIYQTSGSETRSEEENHFKWISCQKHFHFWRRFFTASSPCHRCSGFWTKKKRQKVEIMRTRHRVRESTGKKRGWGGGRGSGGGLHFRTHCKVEIRHIYVIYIYMSNWGKRIVLWSNSSSVV